jgi:hypothetical protein
MHQMQEADSVGRAIERIERKQDELMNMMAVLLQALSEEGEEIEVSLDGLTQSTPRDESQPL